MSARRAPFRQADLRRALKGAQEAGMAVARIEIGPDGRIAIIAGMEASEPADGVNPWDEGNSHAADEKRTS